jgi:hypothetical protein
VTRAPGRRRSSRLGGALLLGGLALLIAVLAIVLVGGDEEDRDGGTPAAQAEPQRATTTSASANAPVLLQQVNLRPPGGGKAPLGIAFLMRQDGRPVVAIQVQDIAPNGRNDVYTAWLRHTQTGRARFLGYVPELVGADGRFTVSSNLPRDLPRYDQIVISREPITRQAPKRPTEIVLQGTLQGSRTG